MTIICGLFLLLCSVVVSGLHHPALSLHNRFLSSSNLSRKPYKSPNFSLFAASNSVEASDWQFLDAIYLITTFQSSPERLAQTFTALDDVGLKNKIKIRKFQADDGNRVRGCYTSHISVINEIQKEFKNKKNYQVLILEDNIEVTSGMQSNVLQSVGQFMQNNVNWDVFHLAYMMYVPGLNLIKLNRNPAPELSALKRESFASNIVQMFATQNAVVGTSAYVISKTGVEKMLARHKAKGFTDAIPNVMAELFPTTRFASYPMVFHRAGKVNSLVNPQLDNFRRIMFNPIMYTTWERLMVSTGLQNNQLFPAITVSLLIATLYALYSFYESVFITHEMSVNFSQVVVIFPLFVALWGASLFQPGNKGRGFAKTAE